MIRILVMPALVFSLLAGAAQAMLPEDIFGIRTTEVVDLSPDGRYLLYAIGTWDQEGNTRLRTVSRRDLNTGQDLVVFTPEDHCSGAVWHPRGEVIAYLRQTDDGTEVWQMSADGGDRRRISEGAGQFGALVWSPDGTALAWTTGAEVSDYEGVPGHYVVADHLGYRHLGQGYREGQLGQLFVMDLANGVPRRLVSAALDVRKFSWSPDSRELVFAAKATENLGLNLNTDLYVVGRGGGPTRQLTRGTGMDSDPRWLEDGRIAWLQASDPLWETAPRRVVIMDPAEGAESRPEIHGVTLDAYYFRWEPYREGILALAARRGALELVYCTGEKVRWLTDFQHDFWSLAVSGPRVLLQGVSQTNPGAIYAVDLAEKIKGPHTPRVVVDPHADWVNRVGLSEPQEFSVEVEGRQIHGWYYLPHGFEPGQQVPVVLSIHGGPEWMYGGYFLPEFHILPRFGYAVLIANPTGSLGYGGDFQAAIQGDWVGRPAREVMACLDWAVDQGWADPERLAVMGGSYGGHLAAELTTQGDRFQAAALDRMYPDLTTFWGTTDEKWFPEWEFGGRPWDPGAAEIYRRNSPWTRVQQVNTPTLVSQGHLDFRCLAAGGQMWFSALQARGVPSRFLRFENEGHGLRDPRNQVFYQHQLLNWFEQFVLDLTDSNGDHHVHD
jgi:dipeptidyl aminopeptidase/acylaminoacyl peptidase